MAPHVPEPQPADAMVSVILPFYNASRYFREALESVITQPHLKEVVVVDDGSTESETDIIGEYAPLVRLISQEHAGIGAARNRGVDQATGEYLSFIDADDIWAPEKLRLQIEAIRSDDAVDAVLGSVSEFISPDLKDSCAYMIDKNRKYYAAHVGSMLIRRSVFMEIGPFETRWKLGEWIDWYLRFQERQPRIVELPDVLYYRRIHGRNTVITERDSYGDYLHVLKQSMDRRRKNKSVGNGP